MRRPVPPRPDPGLLGAVPPGLARRALALPVRVAGGVLHLRCADRSPDADVLDELRVRAGAADVAVEHDADAARHLIAAYARHALDGALDDPVALLDVLLDLAAGSDASDVHLDAEATGIRVRQRIDGDLHHVVHVPAGTAPGLVARTKVRAGLDVAERRLPQDGRLVHLLPDGELDVRVATMPTRLGERVTLRLLPDRPGAITLRALGLSDAVIDALERAAARSAGLIVVCGPTGSGKTTTLHAVLALVARDGRNVMTLEDPVERAIPGTSQTQVAPDHGLPFETALRSVLRHDPDVLLVGEVRDRDTARLAVEAAQTGHLVLTSLHASDAPGALTRLRELGVPAGLLADTLELVVAQRLLALPCPDCDTRPGRAASGRCAGCGATGTRGRSAIAELLEPDAAVRALLRDGREASAHHRSLAAVVRPRLREVALGRARDGLARTVDALRATPDPDHGIAPEPQGYPRPDDPP